jgi:hypothetical protein
MKTNKKSFLLFVFTLMTVLYVKAQWTEVNNLTFDYLIGDLSYVKGNKIWLTNSSGPNSYIISEYDSTFNFVKQINLSAYNILNVQSVYVSNSDTVFLTVTLKFGNLFRNGLLATYDGGYTFTSNFFFNTLDFSTTGANVSFFNSKIGFFTKDTIDNDCRLTYQTYDAGKTWERITDCDRFKYTIKQGKPGAVASDVKNTRQNGSSIWLGWSKKYDSNYVRYTYDYGNTWHDKLINQLKTGEIANKNAARYILYSPRYPFIAYTSDSGNTFQNFQRDEIINNIRYCENPNGQGFYIMSTENGTYLNYNEDNNWKKIDNENFTLSQFYSATNGFALKIIDQLIVQVYNYNSDNKVGLKNNLRIESPISIYPNPATNILTIDLPNQNLKNYQANIYSYNGSLLKTETLTNQTINIENLPNGLYLLELVNTGADNNTGQKRYVSKFIKE